jgi:hypothetical protein
MAFLDDLKTTIFGAAQSELNGKPQVIINYLKTEGEKLAITLVMIANGVADGSITQDEAPILLNQQKQAALSVMTAAEGMSIVVAQNAINSILNSVKQLVNSKLPFPLL